MKSRTKNIEVKIQDLQFSNQSDIILISGPCQIENEYHALKICEKIIKISNKNGLKFVYKSSFDKANRTSIKSSRGVGIEKGLKILQNIKSNFGIPVLTDVHESWQCQIVSEVVDIIQIPAFLCRQTDLLISAAKTKKAVNVKKGQFLSPFEMKHIVSKLESTGNRKILITERGTMFGYNNLVTDLRSLSIMKKIGYPVIFDATHSIQLPGASISSGGESEFIPILSKAAVTVGISSLFIETHDNPASAPSDSSSMLKIQKLSELLNQIKMFDALTKKIL
ncbi:MAG: 3-deoxy-8-phosphooctulonate synthase [Rickettsiales bacterium]|nr:3-deoxy-8-phosphooctulonate synthase [Rickettsiales bacterium]